MARKRILAAVLSSLLLAGVSPAGAAEPAAITSAEVIALRQGTAILIDTRSLAEWEVLRMPASRCLPGFSLTEGDLLDLRPREATEPKLIFVGNTSTEAGVVEAAARAAKWAFRSVFVLSGGVNEWSQAMPGRTLLFGLPLDSPEARAKRLTKPADMEALMVSPAVFREAAASRKFTVLDIRAPGQRVKVGLLPEPVTRLSPDDFVWALRRQSIPATRLLIADYDGRMLPTLLHYLARYEVTDFRCLRGGQLALQAAEAPGVPRPVVAPAPSPPPRPTEAPQAILVPLATPLPR